MAGPFAIRPPDDDMSSGRCCSRLDSRSQLHFYPVAFVGEAGLYAGADQGCVGIRGARHPALFRQRQ